MGQVSGHPPVSAAEAAQQVALACRIIAEFGHEDLTLGHASVRGPDGRTIHIKRKGKALRYVLAEDVIPVALDVEEGYLTAGAHVVTVMYTEASRVRSAC